jgi:hypothetical protein
LPFPESLLLIALAQQLLLRFSYYNIDYSVWKKIETKKISLIGAIIKRKKTPTLYSYSGC